MSLPPEILDHILSFLKFDKATLEVCSRSHPNLSRLVERYFYSSVIIQDKISGDEFLQELRDRANIANYVHALDIKYEGKTEDLNDLLVDISLILPKLSKLRRIGLLGGTTRFPLAWNMLPKQFHLAFSDCLRLPSMTDICIECTFFPLSTLSQCKHIEHLSLKRWRAPVTGDDDTCLPTIDSLALHECDPGSLSMIVSWIVSHHLSSLTFSNFFFCTSFDDTFSQILIGCSHSLTKLDVDIDTKYASLREFSLNNYYIKHPGSIIPIPFPILRNLQHLTMRARLHCVDADLEWPPGLALYSPIFAIAEVLKSASYLKRLILDFHFFISSLQYQSFRSIIRDTFCGALHSLLVQSASTIESFVLQVGSKEPQFISPNIIASMFAGHSNLRQFVENGKLVITPVNVDIHNQ